MKFRNDNILTTIFLFSIGTAVIMYSNYSQFKINSLRNDLKVEKQLLEQKYLAGSNYTLYPETPTSDFAPQSCSSGLIVEKTIPKGGIDGTENSVNLEIQSAPSQPKFLKNFLPQSASSSK